MVCKLFCGSLGKMQGSIKKNFLNETRFGKVNHSTTHAIKKIQS